MAFTADGLVIPRLPEIVAELVSKEQINIHPNINTQSDVLLGQMNNVIADEIATVYEYLEYAYNQKRLQSAEGRGLDELGILKGITRLQASQSLVEIVLEGTEDTYIPSNALVEDSGSTSNPKNRFLTQENKRIQASSSISTVFTINTSAPDTDFTITLDGVDYTQTSPPVDVVMADLLAVLADAINSVTNISATSDATSITVTSDDYSNIVMEAGSAFDIGTVKSKVQVKSVLYGSTTAPTPSTSWRILSPVIGWAKAYPIMSSAQNGRDIETDTDFRIRIRTSASTAQRGTTRAVLSQLLNLTGVTHATVVENTTGAVVDGIPAYGLSCIVEGGSNEDIAKTIWETKGTCTPLLGEVHVDYVDEFGITRGIDFDRPTALNMDVQIVYEIYSEEELTDDFENVIKAAIVDYFSKLGLGMDVIPSKLYAPIYTSISGLNILSIVVREHGVGSYQSYKFPIASTQYAKVTVENIAVILD